MSKITAAKEKYLIKNNTKKSSKNTYDTIAYATDTISPIIIFIIIIL